MRLSDEPSVLCMSIEEAEKEFDNVWDISKLQMRFLPLLKRGRLVVDSSNPSKVGYVVFDGDEDCIHLK